MSYSLSFLLSGEAAALRIKARKPAFVVHAEVAPGEFQELDGTDLDHARGLARVWTENGMAISAAVRRVHYPRGDLGHVVGRIENGGF